MDLHARNPNQIQMKPRSAYSVVRDGSPLKAALVMEFIGLESIRLLNEMWDKGESTSKESCIIQYVETVEADKSPIIQGRDHIRVQNPSSKRMYHMHAAQCTCMHSQRCQYS